MSKMTGLGCVILVFVLWVHPAAADSLLNLSVGAFNFDGDQKHDENDVIAGYIGMELIPDIGVNIGSVELNPVVGLFLTGDGGSMIYSGLNLNVPVSSFEIRPFLAIGVYNAGQGVDLAPETSSKTAGLFNVGLGLFYVAENDWRIGITCNHLSHAQLLSSDSRNPGADSCFATIGILFNN